MFLSDLLFEMVLATAEEHAHVKMRQLLSHTVLHFLDEVVEPVYHKGDVDYYDE